MNRCSQVLRLLCAKSFQDFQIKPEVARKIGWNKNSLQRPVYDISRTLAITGLFLVTPTSYAWDSHCSAKEQIVFSCTNGKKIASLCASANLSSEQGYAQYRFGSANHVEFVFPSTLAHPKNYFKQGGIGYARGGIDYYKFYSEGFAYVVYGGSGVGWIRSGVQVKKGNTRVANFICKNDGLGPDDWRVMYSAGIPEVEESDAETEL